MATTVALLAPVRGTALEFTTTAATADTADLAEVFEITPTKGELIIHVNNVSGANGTVTWSLAAGTHWAAGAALTGSIAQGKAYILRVDTAKYKGAAGKLSLTITPASGKKLKTDHTLVITATQI